MGEFNQNNLSFLLQTNKLAVNLFFIEKGIEYALKT